MRVAVYSPAKDEERHAEYWARSTADADVRVVLDTGSTDGTVDALRNAGVTVVEGARIEPFRFDVAFNTALAFVPANVDWCIVLALDERLEPGWRDTLERRATAGDLGRVRYHWAPTDEHYHELRAWGLIDGSHHIRPQGQKPVEWLDCRCHRRGGFFWRYPVHEQLTPYGGRSCMTVETGMTIYHCSDKGLTKPYYMAMLKSAVEEEPHSDRMKFYYGRELAYAGEYDAAVEMFYRCAQAQAQRGY